jgi:hypothetical protein
VKRGCTDGRTIANHLFDADGGSKIMIASLRHGSAWSRSGNRDLLRPQPDLDLEPDSDLNCVVATDPGEAVFDSAGGRAPTRWGSGPEVTAGRAGL